MGSADKLLHVGIGHRVVCFALLLIPLVGIATFCLWSIPGHDNEPPRIRLAAAATRVKCGENAGLRWITRNATHCVASGAWTGEKPPSGSEWTQPLVESADFGLTCDGPGGTTPATIRISVGDKASSSRFPLRLAPGKRHLIDADGHPFLIHGDSAWSLIAQLRKEDVDTYLRDRRSHGFNTVVVNLVQNNFSSDPPKNAYGEEPFVRPGDFGATNETYFEYSDWILKRASGEGFLVLLAPAYLGNDGWYDDMSRSGPQKLHSYGAFLGNRYKTFGNILWVHSGDLNPPDRSLLRAIAHGIYETAPETLATVHCAIGTSSFAYWSREPWLSIDSLYTFDSVYQAARAAYQRPAKFPFLLLEGRYENERDTGSWLVRSQAYQTLLTGAAGHVFGNNPVWHFGAGGMFPSELTWKDSLNSP